MKKNKQLLFTKVLYGVFLISTILSLIIVYVDADSDLLFKFVVGYVFLAFFILLYVPTVTIMNLRKNKWQVTRKSLIKFFTLFILSSVLLYGFNYLFRPEAVDLITTLSISFGVSFGVTFFDLVFFKGNSKK